jgi:hypothetical protein
MGFIEDYLLYTESVESPEIFSTWCAYSCLSAAAQRKIWMDMDLFRVVPNLYITLIAPPGRCRKGVSMGIAKELVDSIESIKTKSDSITKEAIFEAMEASVQRFELPEHRTGNFIHSSLTIYANEMSLLIKKGDKDFVAALNSLFDSQIVFKHTTKTRGENKIVNPYLNILGCTTPDWINANIHEDILEGGLSARTMLICMYKPKPPNPEPKLSDESRVAKLRLMKRLNQILNIGGKYRLNKEAREYYNDWYIRHYNIEPPSQKLTGYWHRKATHLLKLSMLTSLAVHDHNEVSLDDVKFALGLLDMSEPCFEEALKGVGRNQLSSHAQDILEFVKMKGSVEQGIVLANFYHTLNEKEFVEIIATLIATQRIDRQITETGKTLLKIRKVE